MYKDKHFSDIVINFLFKKNLAKFSKGMEKKDSKE